MNQPVMDHWTTVKRIHQSALDIAPSERAAFVDESCGGDEALRRDVESLLTYAAEAETFLERPAVDIASRPPVTSRGHLRGHLKVLDFGVAKMKLRDESTRSGEWTLERGTAIGSVIGSGPYMSPEQITGGDVDPRTDVFSLGVVINKWRRGTFRSTDRHARS